MEALIIWYFLFWIISICIIYECLFCYYTNLLSDTFFLFHLLYIYMVMNVRSNERIRMNYNRLDTFIEKDRNRIHESIVNKTIKIFRNTDHQELKENMKIIIFLEAVVLCWTVSLLLHLISFSVKYKSFNKKY